MGNSSSSIKKVNFENIIDYQKGHGNGAGAGNRAGNGNIILLISTLPQNEQSCLISKTIPSSDEESVINKALSMYYKKITIYVYGKNSHDMTIVSKAKQLMELGFSNVYVYVGGLFEWLLLQEIYGSENIKTTGEELDILKFRPQKNCLNEQDQLRLTNFASNN